MIGAVLGFVGVWGWLGLLALPFLLYAMSERDRKANELKAVTVSIGRVSALSTSIYTHTDWSEERCVFDHVAVEITADDTSIPYHTEHERALSCSNRIPRIVEWLALRGLIYGEDYHLTYSQRFTGIWEVRHSVCLSTEYRDAAMLFKLTWAGTT